MTLQSRISDLITAIGTDYKAIKTMITGSAAGDLSGLTTTAKGDLVAAINEVKASAGWSPVDASTTVKGISMFATNAEVLALTDSTESITPAGLASILNVNNGIPKLDGTGKVGTSQLPALGWSAVDSTTSVKGIAERATDAEALAMSSSIVDLAPSNLAAIVNVNNGLLKLDSGGKVAAAQLPAYVDDVLEYANQAGFPGSGTAGLIYVALDTNKVYRWSGTVYVEISASPGSTDVVTEGATNLYYTATRADARVVALVGTIETDLVALYTTAKA